MGLIWHVDAEFGRRDKVLPRALSDHHSSFLVEHGRDLGWRLWGGKIFGRFWVVAALEVVGDVAVLAEEGEELQQEVAEVLTDAKPP